MPSGTLEVTIVAGRDLKLMDMSGSNDPYVMIKLGPQKFKTSVKPKAGASATWNEVFQLGLIEKYTDLILEVYDQDKMMDDTIGKTTIPLKNLLDQGLTDSWFTVGKGSKATGEIHARIHFKQGNFPEGYDPNMTDWEANAKTGAMVGGGILAAGAAAYGAKLAYDHYNKKGQPVDEEGNPILDQEQKQY